MDTGRIKLIAMDLDGTLTQHKQPIPPKTREALEALAARYRLVMVGAGQVKRIFEQMGHFPVNIIGNYGLQYAEYNARTGEYRKRVNGQKQAVTEEEQAFQAAVWTDDTKQLAK